MQQSKAESFSAYLEAKARSQSNNAPSTGTPFALLSTLAATDQKQMPLQNLMTASGMGFNDFADALRSLEKSGYLALTGAANAEIAKLTPAGEEVSRLSRRP